MFNSMKNQIREKTGRDLPKFTPQKGGLSRQSRQGSESSLSSLVLEPAAPPAAPVSSSSSSLHSTSAAVLGGSSSLSLPATLPVQSQDVLLKLSDGKILNPKEVSLLSKKEDEWRGRLEKKEAEWRSRLERREGELREELRKREEDWRTKELLLTEELAKSTGELRDALKAAEDYKKKVCQYQEDKDQLESFQTQEMAKIKHLLLAKEKESAETAAALKESQALVDNLKTEVSRLRPLEEKISNYEDDIEMLRHTSEKERWNLSSKLAQSEEQVRHLTDRVAVLSRRSESSGSAAAGVQLDDRVQALLGERALLERRLEEAHVHLTDIKASWSAQISSLETQVGRLSRQAGEEGAERRRAEARVTELEAKLEEEAKEKERINQKVSKLSEEVDSLASELKGANALIEKDKNTISELTRKLRDAEDLIASLQSAKERLEEDLKSEKEVHTKSKEEVISLKTTYEQDLTETKKSLELANQALNQINSKYDTLSQEANGSRSQLNKMTYEVEDLKRRLEVAVEEKASAERRLEERGREMEMERAGKEEALLRNAQVSQEVDMARSELRQQATEHEELFKKVTSLEKTIQLKDQELKKTKEDYAKLLGEMSALQTEAESRQAAVKLEENLREKIANLEQQVVDRNKTIRVQQQKLSDMKKTLQRELKSSDPGGGAGQEQNQTLANNHTPNQPSLHFSNHQPHKNGGPDDEVNFLYLKHVIMKFLTSREYEAQHLTRAVATLLKLSPEEECLLRDTLDWKMSWFGTKPKLQDYSHS